MTTEERYNLIYGNTARATEPAPEQPQPKKPQHNTKKRRRAASQTPFEIEWKNKRTYLAVLLIAFLCLSYVYLNAGNNQMRKDIAALKTDLNTIQIENDDLEAKINSEIDETAIKKAAKEKLGMQKLDNNQKVYVSLPKKDYVETASEKVIIEEEENIFQRILKMFKNIF